MRRVSEIVQNFMTSFMDDSLAKFSYLDLPDQPSIFSDRNVVVDLRGKSKNKKEMRKSH